MWICPILALVIVLGLAVYFSTYAPYRSKWLASIGLFLDVLGAALVAIPLFVPYKEPVEEGKQFLTYYEPHKSNAIVQHQEKLTLPMQIGASLFISGFAFQLLSQWA